MHTHNPDKVPEIDHETLMRGIEMGLRPLKVVCFEPRNPADQDSGGAQFTTFVHFVPRIGERITLENGAVCEVRRIYHKIMREPGDKMTSLVPTVVAVLLQPADA